MKTVCLLTAGLGTRMGPYAGIINKTLLPVDNKAIISHIIEQFDDDDDTKFVIATGFGALDVESYIRIAHPKIKQNLHFVEVDNFQGEGTGPGYSLSKCKPYLTEPFMIVACDGLYDKLNEIPFTDNYMAVSKVTKEETPAYCNVKIENGEITEIKDKQLCDFSHAASGVWVIHDTGKFWEDLQSSELSTGFANLKFKSFEMNWTDLGTYPKYRKYVNSFKKYDFSKLEEMLYFVNGRVIKWFKDGNIVTKKIIRTMYNEFLPETRSGHRFLYHDYVPGQTVYECYSDDILNKLVLHLVSMWRLPNTTNAKITIGKTKEFYMNKTMARLFKFEQKYPDFCPKVINGVEIKYDINECLAKINWNDICYNDLPNRTVQFHGDLQFDNIIYDGEKFHLIDWRDSFAGNPYAGDIYYDYGKLLAGTIINFKNIKEGKFTFSDDNGIINYSYVNDTLGAEEKIKHLLGLENNQTIDNIVSLIFLNMAPLHQPDFDKLLYCVCLERLNAVLHE